MNYSCLSLLFLLSTFSLFAQDHSTGLMKTMDGFLHFDNSKGSHYTFELKGKNVQKVEIDNAFMLDEEFIQVIKHRFDPQEHGNPQDTAKERALLLHYRKYELDYIQEEMFNEPVKHSMEIFFNSKGKRFLLWYYKMPDKVLQSAEDEKEIGDPTQYQLFLTAVCNDVVSGLSLNAYRSEKVEDKISLLKNIAETFCIYGGPIHLDALAYQLEAKADGERTKYGFEKMGFEFIIPEWMNMIQMGNADIFMGTLPDNNNIKNAIMVEWFDKKTLKKKEKIKNFEAFNKKHILDKKIGDNKGGMTWLLKKELPTPPNCNGICYNIQSLFKTRVYHTKMITFETKTTYILVRFVATESTYEKNVGKFDAFIKDFDAKK